uniref:Putative 5'-AMP-activated protein kinase subunit beta-1 family protein n=1 Tax=Toxoplasma gondii COUG TaxID=1074873 RepID=A0A2G8Y1Z2_TOXGO|nr:putative 5'-AMP-activated protein kinase subunit beta-1 family protein [Toxoplasma gondii COUG]
MFLKNLSRIDDQWKYAPDQQTQTDEHGNVNNVLDISSFTHFNFKVLPENEQASLMTQAQRRAPRDEQCITNAFPSRRSTPQMRLQFQFFWVEARVNPVKVLWGFDWAVERGWSITQVARDPPPQPGKGVPLHCLANHLFHDALSPSVFGSHTSCIATTHRWQIDNARPTSGQRYTTYIYVTVNPLYPFASPHEEGDAERDREADAEAEAAAIIAAACPSAVANLLVFRGETNNRKPVDSFCGSPGDAAKAGESGEEFAEEDGETPSVSS